MDVMMTLPDAPKEDVIPQQMLVVRLCLEAAEKDENLLAQLVANPGQVFASAGFPVNSWAIPEFNDYCRKEQACRMCLRDWQIKKIWRPLVVLAARFARLRPIRLLLRLSPLARVR